jgi:hypothetical protein
MVSRKGLACVAACAAMAIVGLARAEDAAVASPEPRPLVNGTSATLPSELTLSPWQQVVYLDDTTTTPTPAAAPASAPATPPTLLMGLVGPTPIGQALNALHTNIYGHVEGSFTYQNEGRNAQEFIDGRIFDSDSEYGEMNQAYIIVERTVTDALKANTFDIGARFDIMYGTDARFIHSLGNWDTQDHQYQWDITQLYGDIAIPGIATRLRVGKFVTLAGQEVIDPTGNLFYSHSDLFNYAIPLTQTGGYATFNVGPNLVIDAGTTRGWDVSLKSYNDNWDGIARAAYSFNDPNSTVLTGDIIAGEDQPIRDSKWREVADVILTTNVGDRISLAVNGDYGHEEHSAALGGATAASWYGAAGYFSYGIDRPIAKSPYVALNGRVEYFNDDKGVRVPGALAVGGVELAEGTIGLAITPFADDATLSNLVFRPEFRFDYANKPFFDSGANRYQYTAAIDAIFKF